MIPMSRSIFLVALACMAAAGCTTTSQFAATGFAPPTGNYRLIVVQPDVSVGMLTAGGLVEPREDWTKQARENVLKAIAAQQATRGGDTRIAETAADVGADSDSFAQLVRLHDAVGRAVFVHKYMGLGLPTKRDTFDWTLGESAVQLGVATGYDYALFLQAEDSFSSGGRVALQMAGLLTCAVGVCVAPQGGSQSAFASLVDLRTGKVVWFNALASSVGDIRTPEGAEKMVRALLDRMKAGKA